MKSSTESLERRSVDETNRELDAFQHRLNIIWVLQEVVEEFWPTQRVGIA